MTTVQDRGRSAALSQGVPASGAFDRQAFDLANRLVGNAATAAVLEMTMGGFRAIATSSCVIALTGAVGPASVDAMRPVALRSGDEIVVGRPTIGVRTYLAIRGGVDTPLVVGSRSWDSLGRLGPPPLCLNDEIQVADHSAAAPLWGDPVPTRGVAGNLFLSEGPHLDLLSLDTREQVLNARWTVSSRADRIGVHIETCNPLGLEGLALGSVPSFAMLPGSVQLPPDGRPIILGPDAGVTGGYPVVGVVDLSAVAQFRPGDEFRFERRTHRSRLPSLSDR